MAAIEIGPALPLVPPGLLFPGERGEQEVRCGRWSLRTAEGRLDDIRLEGASILRGVRVVVRDRDWGTFATARAEVRSAGEALVIEGASEGDVGRVDWTLRASFDDSSLRIALEARVATAFLRNRLGLIVLHPTGLSGAPLDVRHSDGSVERTRFPERISPHQPARDIAELVWAVDGVTVSAAFDGDVFEMEDQRNWTDGSFKTYSTPLDLPFPVAVAEGETLRQSLVLTCTGTPVRDDPAASDLRIEAIDGTFPRILTAASSAPGSARPRASRTAAGGLLVEIDPRWSGWRRALARALEDAEGRPVDLRIVATTAADVDQVVAATGTAPLSRIGAFAAQGHLSTPELLDAVRRAAQVRGVEAVGGVRSHFTELNRSADAVSGIEAPLAFSLTPAMHDTSAQQLVDSLAVQATVLRDALAIADGRTLHIGPITLGPRMNAVSTSPFSPGDPDIDASGYGPQSVPGATDPRQDSPALAAWVVGSLAALAQAGVDSLTYFEEWGPRGAVHTPAGRVLEWATALTSSPLLACTGGGVVGVGDESPDGQLLLLGNVGGTAVEPRLSSVREWLRSGDGSRGVGDLRLEPGDAVRVVREGGRATERPSPPGLS